MIMDSLNIRGACSVVRRWRIHQIICKGKAEVFLIQETKLKECSASTARSFWNKDGIEFSASNSSGLSGGLLILWNSQYLDVLCSFSGPGYLGIKALWRDKIIYICNVYSPCIISLKQELWKNILNLKEKFRDGEWLVGGYFNAVKRRSERKGKVVLSMDPERGEFSGFINELGLLEIPCKGKKCSWFSSDGISKSRIDRFLVSN